MGLFGKRRESGASEDRGAPRDDPAGDAAQLEERLRAYNEQISEASGRLDEINAEYNAAVSDLMRIKKEINDRREEKGRLDVQNTNIQTQIAEGRQVLRSGHRNLDLAEKAAADLKQIRADLDAKTHECRKEQGRLDRIKRELAAVTEEVAQRTRENESLARERDGLDARLAETAAHLDRKGAESRKVDHPQGGRTATEYEAKMKAADADIRSMRAQLADRDATIRDLKARLDAAESARLDAAESPKLDGTAAPSASDKGVIEAASSIVASFRTRLAETEEDLAAVRRELDQERAGRTKTGQNKADGADQAGK